MMAVVRAGVFDVRKILSSRTFWVVALVLVISQPFFAFIEANQIAGIGVNATPETHPELAEALPPVAFMGFDVMPFGEVVVIVLGALLGAAEYRDRELRTTFLAIGRRPRERFVKYLFIFMDDFSIRHFNFWANKNSKPFSIYCFLL